MSRLALAAVLAFGLAGAAHAANRTEQRDLKGFTQVRLDGAAAMPIHPGTFAVKVSGPADELSSLTTKVEDGTLVLASIEGADHVRGLSVEIALPRLDGFELDGAGDIRIDGFKDQAKLALTIKGAGNLRYSGSAQALDVQVRGTGDVTLEGGKTDQLAINLAGLGHVKATGFDAKNAKVDLGGTGSVELTSNGGTVAIDLSGMGNVQWRGSSKPISIERSGMGHIEHEG